MTTERAFAIKICLGLGVGFWFLLWSAYQYPQPQPKRWLDVYLGVILGSILGARLIYVLFNIDRFASEPLNIPRLWYGELAWQGAFIGGGIALWGMCRWRKVPSLYFMDTLTLVLPIMVMTVCWAARSAGLILGKEALDQHPVWMVGFLPELNRNVAPRYELQMLGVALSGGLLLLGGILTLWQKLIFSRAWLILGLTGIVIFVLNYLGAGESKILYGIHVEQISAGILWIVGWGMFALQESVNRMENTPLPPLIDRL